MGIRKRCRHEEPERVVVHDILFSDLYDVARTLFDLLLKQDRLKSRIQFFTNIFKQDPFTKLDSQF